MTGRVLGRYRIVGQIGRVDAGIVYRAVDESLDRRVAITILGPGLASPDVMRRLRADASSIARLGHPQIATIDEPVPFERGLLMVTELVPGQPLDRVLEWTGPLESERAAYLIDLMLSGLAHAHRAGIVHGDLEPANVMVTEEGGLKITSFGVARVLGAKQKTVDFRLTGAPAYMPPELVVGEAIDQRSDLYSVGVLFYQMLTGALPFEADTALGMLQQHLRATPLPLSAHRKDLPDWCSGVVQRALAKAPADRYQSAEEFRHALLHATGPLALNEISRTFVLPAGQPLSSRDAGVALDLRTVTPVPTVIELPLRPRRGIRWTHAAQGALAVVALAAIATTMGYPAGRDRVPDAAPHIDAGLEATPAAMTAPLATVEPAPPPPAPAPTPSERVPPEPAPIEPEPTPVSVEPAEPLPPPAVPVEEPLERVLLVLEARTGQTAAFIDADGADDEGE